MSLLYSSLQKVYSVVTGVRNFAYDSGMMDSLTLYVPVISVGNLTVGGTGKTPVVQWLIEYLKQTGKKPLVVGRNYKANVNHVCRVNPEQKNAAFIFGDEPTLLALKDRDVPVYVGPAKYKSAAFALLNEKVDVLLIDDGFQHRALHRDLDILLIDATATFSDYELLPVGKAREPLDSIERANWIILTKTNFVDELKIEEWYRLMTKNAKVIELAYRLKADFLNEAGKKALAFAGLARPESFQNSLQNDSLYDIVGFVPYPDHHRYSEKDVEFLMKQKHELDAEVLLTTEKDWVKIKDYQVDHNLFRALGLEVHSMSALNEFHAAIDQLFIHHK